MGKSITPAGGLSRRQSCSGGGPRSVIARMRCQQMGGPQLVRVTKLRRLRGSQSDKPGSGFRRNPRIPSRARAIVQRCQYSQFVGTL
jgi:hypothetical protein